MAVQGGFNADLLLDGFSLRAFARQCTFQLTQTMLDATAFGNSAHVKFPGLRDGTIQSELFFDSVATTGSWDVITGRYGASTPGIISFAPYGFALGNSVPLIYAYQISFTPRSVFDQLIMLNFAADAAANAIDAGVSLHALSAETVFPFTGTAVDNAASTANGGVGVVHVTAIAGTTPNVVYKIQHSTNNVTYVDLITYGAITAGNSVLRTEVAAGTTVNRYLRITITNGGITSSVTGTVQFARR